MQELVVGVNFVSKEIYICIKLIYIYIYDVAGKPIYSFDLRDESPANEGLLWANEVRQTFEEKIQIQIQ